MPLRSKAANRKNFYRDYSNKGTMEAEVVEVFPEKGTCRIRFISVTQSEYVDNIPIPNIAGLGNSGLFMPLRSGDRVTVQAVAKGSRESFIIQPKRGRELLYPENKESQVFRNVPAGIAAYPVEFNATVLQGEGGSRVTLSAEGDAALLNADNSGVTVNKDGVTSFSVLESEDYDNYSSAGRSISGNVRRITARERNLKPRPGPESSRLFVEKDYYKKAKKIGFFTGSKSARRTIGRRPRNPAIAESRTVYNEFSTDYMFTGFDDEVSRVTKKKRLYQDSETNFRNRERGNVLHMAEHELVEIVAGNLVDINGNVLDINYRKLVYGGPGNIAPRGDLALNYEQAKRLSRRGVGYHFQLSTNTSTSDPSNSASNFIYDIDKEGVIKIHMPASSNTGNIPFPSFAEYDTEDGSPSVSRVSSVGQTEPIPITLRDNDGNPVYPEKAVKPSRETGVRYLDSEVNPYFPSNSDSDVVSQFVRVNPTRYHNMYSAGERLLANRITRIFVPKEWRDEAPAKSQVGKSFEIKSPNLLSDEQRSRLEGTLSGLPKSRIAAIVSPSPPAIDPGGGVVVSGQKYGDDLSEAFTNSFTLAETDEGITLAEGGGATVKQTGGKSAFLDLEGSIEASIGRDNEDQKSVLFDTHGSVIGWIGTDKNGRSVLLQTDGEIGINVGGTYRDEVMSVGRFDLRVNVVDKGLLTTEFSEESGEETSSPGTKSDFIISISEEGLVIAGSHPDMPLVIRNEGPVAIESTGNNVTLKGVEVHTVDASGTIRGQGETGNTGGA